MPVKRVFSHKRFMPMTKAGILSLCSSVLVFLMDQDSLICQWFTGNYCCKNHRLHCSEAECLKWLPPMPSQSWTALNQREKKEVQLPYQGFFMDLGSVPAPCLQSSLRSFSLLYAGKCPTAWLCNRPTETFSRCVCGCECSWSTHETYPSFS